MITYPFGAASYAGPREVNKDPVLKPTLSVFLPVWNRQATLSPLVSHLLEVLPDLTPRFDLVVIDDGSHDATSEIAHDLALLYPQVQRVVHPSRWGRAAAMRTGLLHSSADIVLFRSEGCRLGLGCLPQLWEAVRTHDLAVARAADRGPLGCVPAAPQPKTAAEAAQADLHMIRRGALDAWRRDLDDDDWLAYIVGHRYRCLELALDRPTRVAVWGRGPASWPHPSFVPQPPSGGRAGARRPNYLARIKAFALGE